MKKTILAMAAATALAVPAMAADETLIYRGSLALISPTSDSTFDGEKTEADSALGVDLGFEYKFAKAWGVEAAILYADHDVKVEGQKVGSVTLTPVLFSANYHFPTSGNIDFYVGPTLGYAFWGDVKLDGGPKVPTDGAFVYGVNAGLDVPLKGSWAFTGGIRYLQGSLEGEQGGEIDVNPFVLRAGVAYRF